jgi:hypothetical protein
MPLLDSRLTGNSVLTAVRMPVRIVSGWWQRDRVAAGDLSE